jgi:DNA-binding MarR family transcriptional regulator
MTQRASTNQHGAAPPRDIWPGQPNRTVPGDMLTELVLATFRLNGRLMDTAQHLASAGGLTATEWRVLGGVLDQPRTVSDLARVMGMTRQGVQRVADQIVGRGLAAYQPNPAHRRAKLLACTEDGFWAIRQIALVQRPWADRVGERVGVTPLTETLQTLRQLASLLEGEAVQEEPEGGAYDAVSTPPRRRP